MNIINKNVRIPANLISRVDDETSRSGRTRNAELIALIEEAIIELKYVEDYSLTNSDEMAYEQTSQIAEWITKSLSEKDSTCVSNGDSYQIRMPEHLESVIIHDVPRLIKPRTGANDKPQETFSEKVRYLLLRGLSLRGDIISVELASIHGSVYQDKEVEERFIDLKMAETERLDQMLELGNSFKKMMLSTDGHVLVYGAPGTGKSFSCGYYKTAYPGECHYLNIMQRIRELSTRKTILLWSNNRTYTKRRTLIIDELQAVDNEYLLNFCKAAHKKMFALF